MQNTIMINMASLEEGNINQQIPDVFYETKVHPASNLPRLQPILPPASRSAPPPKLATL